MTLTVGSLFSGIGGLDLSATTREAGMRTSSLREEPYKALPLARGRRIKSDRPHTVEITRQRDAVPLWFLSVAVTLPSP